MDTDFLTSAYPYSGYNFCMILDGFKLGFKSVSGLTLKKDNYIAHHEGGYNMTVGIHRAEKREINHLTLTKGLGFFNPSKLMSKIHVMMLLVFGEDRKLLHAYVFSPGFVESVSVSDFDAQESRLLIDTTVIAYDFAVEIDLTGRTTPIAYAMSIAARIAEQSAAETASENTVKKIREHNESVKKHKESAADANTKPPVEY
ncbi:MAG: hypothetical protein ACI4J1_02850 [Ruminiclostridium sp.]